MPSVTLEGNGSQSKTGWGAADPGSWNTLCFVPEKEDFKMSFLNFLLTPESKELV